MLSFTSSTVSARSTRSFNGISRKEREKIASRDTTVVQEDDLYRYPTEDECRIIRDTWKLISDPNRFRLLNVQLQANVPPVPPLPTTNHHDATSFNTYTSTTQVNPNLNAQLMSISASVSDFPTKNTGNAALNNGATGNVPMRRIPSTRFRDSPYPYPNGGSGTTTSVGDDPSGTHFASPTPGNYDPNRDTESMNSFSDNGSSTAPRPPHMQQNGSRAPSTSASTQGNNPFSGLTPEQLAQISPATQFTMQFFQNLIDSYPYMGGIFSDVVKQSTMFSGLLGKMVRDVYNLRDPNFAAQIRKLGYRHRVLYHISDSMYDALGTSLVRTVRHWLLADGIWTPEIDWAWMAVYNLLATWMKEGGAWEQTGPPPNASQPSQLSQQQTSSNGRYRRSGSVAATKSMDSSAAGPNDGWERYRDMIKAQQASQRNRSTSVVSEDAGRRRREKKRKDAESKCVIS
ncbi:hypothetical protein BJ742DRAFT_832031 [Cladochytrium replicatum]|nr:hypothetical protein BJ742DRAFT_832031 [Cladochytrium replicatum]